MHRTDLKGVKIDSSASKMRKLCVIENLGLFRLISLPESEPDAGRKRGCVVPD